MLSILIPIYNFDCNELVQSLDTQCQAAGIAYEILCYDDASTLPFQSINASLHTISAQVKYEILSTNLGRSKIRNVLAGHAEYDFLLFLDCDTKVIDLEYVERYVKVIAPNRVVCGGRVYSATPPEAKDGLLHWRYGKKREQVAAAVRNKKPYESFMSNNFLIPKKILLAYPFEATLKQYGHEDTYFGLNLQRHNIPLEHIDNPLEHLGLEDIETFLTKQHQAIENLIRLQTGGHPITTKLTDTANKLCLLGIATLLRPFQASLLRLAEQQLRVDNAPLVWLDIWKLVTFLKLQRSSELS